MPRVPGGDGHCVWGDLTIDIARRTVTRAGSTVHLTPTEWGLLVALVKSAGKTITHQQLFRAVWGPPTETRSNTSACTWRISGGRSSRIRTSRRYIVTEPGVGYRFEPEG